MKSIKFEPGVVIADLEMTDAQKIEKEITIKPTINYNEMFKKEDRNMLDLKMIFQIGKMKCLNII